MTPTWKPGEIVYRARLTMDKAQVDAAKVVAATEHRIVLAGVDGGGTGLAFDCRRQFSPNAALYRTAADALRALVAHLRADVLGAQADLRIARAALADLGKETGNLTPSGAKT